MLKKQTKMLSYDAEHLTFINPLNANKEQLIDQKSGSQFYKFNLL